MGKKKKPRLRLLTNHITNHWFATSNFVILVTFVLGPISLFQRVDLFVWWVAYILVGQYQYWLATFAHMEDVVPIPRNFEAFLDITGKCIWYTVAWPIKMMLQYIIFISNRAKYVE